MTVPEVAEGTAWGQTHRHQGLVLLSCTVEEQRRSGTCRRLGFERSWKEKQVPQSSKPLLK